MSIISQNFLPANYQQCTVTVMDNISDDDIVFDSKGICNHYYSYKNFASQEEFTEPKRNKIFGDWINKIKNERKNGNYDCILGLSGGADSSYLAYLAKKEGLKPLIVHFDYGWNTDLAITNIQNITQKLGFELYTYVINWEAMKDLQRSYFKASVIDLDVPADHTIFGAIFELARKMKIKYILSGTNYQTEFIMPKSWNYLKTDLLNMKNIHKKFGERPFKDIPTNGVIDQIKYRLLGYQTVPLLNYVPYNKFDVIELLKSELGWRDYGDKHFENVYTRFYQGYLLPKKFGVDKRKAHLSNLILSNQITREKALEELSKPPYPVEQQQQDKEYIAKKLGFSSQEFEDILHLPNKSHKFYGTDEVLRNRIFNFTSRFLPGKYRQLLKSKLIIDR